MDHCDIEPQCSGTNGGAGMGTGSKLVRVPAGFPGRDGGWEPRVGRYCRNRRISLGTRGRERWAALKYGARIQVFTEAGLGVESQARREVADTGNLT